MSAASPILPATVLFAAVVYASPAFACDGAVGCGSGVAVGTWLGLRATHALLLGECGIDRRMRAFSGDERNGARVRVRMRVRVSARLGLGGRVIARACTTFIFSTIVAYCGLAAAVSMAWKRRGCHGDALGKDGARMVSLRITRSVGGGQ